MMTDDIYSVHNPRSVLGHALYAVPLRLIGDILSVRVADIPEKYRADFCEFVTRGEESTLVGRETVPYSLFSGYCNHVIVDG